MQMKMTYKGYKGNIYGIYCGFKPKGLDVEEEVPVYYPDTGKIFVKDGQEFTSVVLQDGEEISQFLEKDKNESEGDK